MRYEEKWALRFQQLRMMEDEMHQQGISYVGGVDEVGRGPLAGPVVAACVVLPEDFYGYGIDDSKKVPAKRREELYESICHRALAYGIGQVEPDVIDEINILRAAKKAMARAILDCDSMLSEKGIQLDYLLIDGMEVEEVAIPQMAIIKGDATCLSIAAASIVAKVTRDRQMEAYHLQYPGYDFDQNKGYGTPKHYEGLLKEGLCPIHRRSFLKNRSYPCK
jgi:ribonuclease HII